MEGGSKNKIHFYEFIRLTLITISNLRMNGQFKNY